MSTDPSFERASILLRAQSYLLGGRVYGSIPDDLALERGPNGVKPYAVVHYGTVFRLASSRSIVGEEEQPQVLPISITCYARTQEAARASAGAVRDLYVGWAPSPSSSEIEAPGGTAYRDRDSAGVPTLYAEVVSLETVFNLGSNDGYVPTPGDFGSGGQTVESIRDIVLQVIGETQHTFERHDFTTAAGQWTANHMLGRVPVVSIFAPDGTRQLTDEQSTTTQVVVTWATPRAGFLILT